MKKFSTLKPWTGTLVKTMLFQEGTALIVLHLSCAYARQLFTQEKQLPIIYPSRPLLTPCDTSLPSLKLKSNLFSSWWHSAGHLSLKKCCSRKFLPLLIHSRGLQHRLHCDRSKHSTLSHASVSQERPQQGTMNSLLCSQQNPSNSRGETLELKHLPQNCLSHWKHHLSFSQVEQNNCPCPSKWNHDLPVQQTWIWPSNCTAGYSWLIIQRAQPTWQYHIGHFLKNHIILTIDWEVHCSSLGF